MNRRTQVIIGAVIVAMGLGVYALGFIEQESSVRYVADITEDPAAFQEGEYTLLGVPQPRVLHTFGDEGTREDANPMFSNQTVRVTAWADANGTYHTTHTMRVEGPDEEGVSHWSLTNETRRPGRADLAFPATTTNWTIGGQHMVFLVQGFEDHNGETPFLFGVYSGVLREPMQPKPSQFKGHVASELPDGTPLPDGALVYWVNEYTAGCSSKFLPPEYEEQEHGDYAVPPDGTADTTGPTETGDRESGAIRPGTA